MLPLKCYTTKCEWTVTGFTTADSLKEKEKKKGNYVSSERLYGLSNWNESLLSFWKFLCKIY